MNSSEKTATRVPAKPSSISSEPAWPTNSPDLVTRASPDKSDDGKMNDEGEQAAETKLRQQLYDVLHPLILDILNKYPLTEFPKTDIAKVVNAIVQNGDGIAILDAIQKGDDALHVFLQPIPDSKFKKTRVWRYTAHNGTISPATYISLRKARKLMANTNKFCIMPRCLLLLHYPVNQLNDKQERDRHGVGLSYTFRQMKNLLGHLYRSILQAYVDLNLLQGVRVHILIPVPDGVPDARNPDLSKEDSSAVAHFAEAIRMRVRFLSPIYNLCHLIVKSAPVWDEVMQDLMDREVKGENVSMRSLRLCERLVNRSEGLNSAYTNYSIPVVKQNDTEMLKVKNKHPSHHFTQSNEFFLETILMSHILDFPTSQISFHKILTPHVSSFLDNHDDSISEILLGLKNDKATVRRIVKEILNENLVLS